MKRKRRTTHLFYEVRKTLVPTCNKDIVRMKITGKVHAKMICQNLKQNISKGNRIVFLSEYSLSLGIYFSNAMAV